MHLIELITHGSAVFLNPAHVVTVRACMTTEGSPKEGKTAVLLGNGNTMEVDGDFRELATKLGTIFVS